MNNIYRVIWNASTNVWQAVSEIGRSGGKTQSVRDGSGASGQGAMRSFAATALMMACAMAHAGLPLPDISTGANAISATQVGTPDAAIGTVGNKMTITQSTAKAVLNWASFDVASGYTVEFRQLNASDIALNRVIGTGGVIARSLIDGTITAKGNIFLINPAGITFAMGAQVNVGGIVASTRDIADADFWAGKYNFKGDSAAEIRNEGQIKAGVDGGDGYVVMIAAKIVNAVNLADKDTPLDADKGGRITGKNVILAAGDDVLLEIAAGVPAITVTKETENALIHNGGWIYAADGRVLLTAPALEAVIKSAINNSGVIEAGSISMVGDAITLDVAKVPKNEAGDGDSFKLEKSRLIATSADQVNGKSIELTGGTITLARGNELIANQATDATVVLTATTNISNAGSIITGEDGATGTVDMTALGEIKNAASALVKSGTITLDGTSIKLEADDATVKSRLIASTGPVNLMAAKGAISNDGLIQSAAASTSNAPSISVYGDAVTLGASSQLLATNEAASIKVTAASGALSNAGSIITGDEGKTGAVVLTATAGDIVGGATGKILSGTITLDAGKGIDLKSDATDPSIKNQLIAKVGSVTLKATEAISNDGLIETPAVTGETIVFTGAQSISLGANSELRVQATDATIDLTASKGNISNAGSIITGEDGDSGTVNMTALAGTITNSATGVVKSGTIALNTTVKVDDAVITSFAITNDGKLESSATGNSISLSGSSITLGTASELLASQGSVTLDASGSATIDGLVQSKASEGGVITVNAANITLKSNAVLDASGNVAGAVTTNAAFKLDAEDGAQVKTLSSSDSSQLGTWIASAADVHVRAVVLTEQDDSSDPPKKITITGPSGVDLDASTPGALVTRVNLFNTDQMVDASALVGDFSKILKAAKATGTDTTELKVTKQGWNIVVDEAMEKPAAFIVTAEGPLKGQSQPQDVTLTLKSGRDITINEKINSAYGRGRLNLVLDALGDVVIGEKGNITTNSGNVYVGKFTPAVGQPWPGSFTDLDKVDAKGHDFVMQAGAKLDVGGGSLVVNVDNDINLGSGSSIYKVGQTGLRNVFKKTVVNGQWDYSFTPGYWYDTASTISLTAAKDITVAGNITANSTTLNMTAKQNIVAAESGKIVQNGYGTVANIVADGDIGASSNALRVDADVSARSYLKVTNTKGSSYIRNDLGYYNNIVLKTTETTDGVQSIGMKGDLHVLAMATAKHKDINDNDVLAVLSIEKGGVLLTGGVAGQLPGNLEIRAPNILLTSGSIKSTDGSTVPGNDPSLQVPRGSSVTLVAQSNSEPTGYIRSSTPADAKTDGPDIDVATGTVYLNAKNIGTESAGSLDAVNFKQALEVKTTSLRVANAGGDTWLSNSTYNTLSFTMDDAYGTAEGRHHILSSNGDFFNVESTKDHQLVVYSIDRDALSTSPSLSSTQGRMSGIYTRSDKTANKNLDLSSAIYGKARDLIFMEDAVDVGSATLTLGAYSGASALGYSDKLVQDDAKRFGLAITGHDKTYIDGTNKDKPHLTMGNLNLAMDPLYSPVGSIGGKGYDLKVKKGGEATQVNAKTNTLNISNESGDVALHELSAEHFKDITITDDTANTAHTVKLDLYHNNGVSEQLNYTDADGVLKFDKTTAALSGYNRNFRLVVKNKDVEIGGFGTADGKVTSGDFTVYANNIALNGDITTTHRANENAGFDRGNVSLTAYTYTLLSDSKIDTNTQLNGKDAEGADALTPGNIDLASRSNYASNILGNGFSLNVNAKSSDPLVGGGNINAEVFSTGSSSYLQDLSFTTNSVDNKTGKVSISGSKFWLTGDFKASGAVTMSGNQTRDSNTDPYFIILTNKAGTGDSGSITFDGASFTLNKGYGHAVFDTSSTDGAAGNVTLWDSAPDSKHSSTLTVGSLSVYAEGATANGNISVDNVTTTGLSDYNSQTYSYAAQYYVADKVTLGGNLFTKSGYVNVDAKKEVVIANDVKIQTFNGNTDLSDSKHKRGIAGDVTLGATGAKLVATGQTLEIDASAGRSSGALTDPSSFTAAHGLITMNASAEGATEFNKLTLIGSTLEGAFAESKFSTTGQMTLGLLDQATSTWTGIKAGSLLLLGQNMTDYTFTDADIGTLAADATGALTVTSIKPLTVGSLSYSGTFRTTANGISIGDGKEIGGSVELSAGAITVAANSKVVTPVGEIKLTSTDSTTGGITLGASSLVSANDLVTLKTASTGITMGANAIVRGSAGVSLTADTGDIALGEKVTVLASGSGDVPAGDVTMTATKGAITTGDTSFVLSSVGMTTLTAGTGISLGASTTVAGSAGVSLTADTGDIALGEKVKVLASGSSDVPPVGDVTLTATKGAITTGSTSTLDSKFGMTTLQAGTGIILGSSTTVKGAAGVTLTADSGDMALGEGVTVLAAGSGDVPAGDVTLTATKGAITTGSTSTLDSKFGMTTLQSGTGITLGANTTVKGETGVSLTADTGDISLGEKVQVSASRYDALAPVADVTMTASAGAIKIDAGSKVIAYQGSTSLESKGADDKGGISIGKDVYVYGKNDVSLLTQVGQIKIAEGGTDGLIHSQDGGITIAVDGNGSIDFAAGNMFLVSGKSASKISTGTGDITFAGTAYNAGGGDNAEWLVISAGSSKKKEEVTDGNVIFTGNIWSNTPESRSVIYTGSADKAEETPVSYISHYTLGSYVYGFDSTDNKPDFSKMPDAPVVVAFRQKAGNLTLSIPSEKVYSGKTWVNQVADDAVATQEQLALDVSGLRKWESAYVDANRGTASAYDYLAGPEIKWIPSGYSLKSDSGELKNVGSYKVKFEKDSTALEVTNPVGYGVSAPGGDGATVDFKITPKELTVNIQAATKIYDGNTEATLDANSYQLSGFVMAENATVSKTTGAFNSKNVAEANSVTTTLTAADFTPTVDSGFLATNYSYNVVAGQGTIAAKKLGEVALNPATIVKKVYDGNSTAYSSLLDFSVTGLVAGESMTVDNALGQFGSYRDGVFVASKNVRDVDLVQVLMSNPTFTMGAGTLASNYRLPTVIQSETKGQITPRQLLATATAEDKLFDGKVDAKAVIALAKPSEGTGVVGNDQVSLAFRSAEFVDSQVGVNKKVFLRDPYAQGADSDNYVVSFDGEFPAKDVNTQASIRPLSLSPVVMAPPAPVPVVLAPPNFSNGPVQSIGGMGVVNVESPSQNTAAAGEAGGMTAVTIESLLANQAGAPNQVYVVNGGIKFEISDN